MFVRTVSISVEQRLLCDVMPRSILNEIHWAVCKDYRRYSEPFDMHRQTKTLQEYRRIGLSKSVWIYFGCGSVIWIEMFMLWCLASTQGGVRWAKILWLHHSKFCMRPPTANFPGWVPAGDFTMKLSYLEVRKLTSSLPLSYSYFKKLKAALHNRSRWHKETVRRNVHLLL